MEKGISEISGGLSRQVGNKFRRSLQMLQVSADELGLKGYDMAHSDKTSLKEKPKAAAKIIVAEKENVLSVRRSKRKTAVEKLNYAESPSEVKTTKNSVKNVTKAKTASKSKRGRSTVVKKNEQKDILNQTKITFSPVSSNGVVNENINVPQSDNCEKDKLTATTSAEITEDSGFDPNCGVSYHSPMNSTAVSKSPDGKRFSVIPSDNEISIITGSSPPLIYWKDLAEQRRMALEKALHENELLHDQLTVLEAENSQLKQLVREAEHLAQVVRAIVD